MFSKLSAVGENLISGMTASRNPCDRPASREERSLELAIDLDALIAVVIEEGSEEERRTSRSRWGPAVTTLLLPDPLPPCGEPPLRGWCAASATVRVPVQASMGRSIGLREGM